MSDDGPSPAGGGPIFILGAMGSGTTLLRLMLDSHPRIAIPQETGFARAMMAQRYVPFWLFGDQWWGRLGYTEPAFLEHLRHFYETMFQHYAQLHGKVRWGEKTPFHAWHADHLATVFADAVFVVIVRHPGANVGSLDSRFGFPLRRGIEHWSTTNRQLLAVAEDHRERTVFCRYEDLVLQPEPTMRELLDWLQEPWSPAVLEHHVVHSERGTPQKVEGRTRSDDPIDAERISKWVTKIDQPGMDLLRKRTDDIARFFGYAVDDPRPIRPLGGDGQILMGAEQVAQRLDEYRATVAILRQRPEHRLRDQPLDPRVMGPSAGRARNSRKRGKRVKPGKRRREGAGAVPARRRTQGTGARSGVRSLLGRVRRAAVRLLRGSR